MEECGGAVSYPQQWVFDAGQLHLSYTFYEGLCLDAGDGKQRTELLLEDCSPTSRVQQTFDMVEKQGSHFIVHNASGEDFNTKYFNSNLRFSRLCRSLLFGTQRTVRDY
jgi:hypothetical protein